MKSDAALVYWEVFHCQLEQKVFGGPEILCQLHNLYQFHYYSHQLSQKQNILKYLQLKKTLKGRLRTKFKSRTELS